MSCNGFFGNKSETEGTLEERSGPPKNNNNKRNIAGLVTGELTVKSMKHRSPLGILYTALTCSEDFSAIKFSKILPPQEWPNTGASPRQSFT